METDAEDADFLECACPHCGQTLSFPVTYAGTAQMCIRCSEVVIVPKDGASAAGKLPLPLTTARLHLRRLRPDDWKDLLDLMSDEQPWQYRDQDSPDEEAVTKWLESDARNKLTEGHPLALGMELKSSGKLMGSLSIWYDRDNREQAIIDLMVHRSYQRQQYGREAVAAILGFGFEAIHLHRIMASCDSRNLACHRMLEHVGMRREAEFVQDHLVKGEWANTVWYAILASEFQAKAR